jgi:fatty acid desaturase
VIVALMAPWTLRNYRLYGAFLPITSAAKLPPLQGELFVRGIYAPETFAQFADLSADGFDDRRFAERVSAEVERALPPASPDDRLRFQRIRARMLAISLVTPFKFPETRATEMLWIATLNVALMLLALVGVWRFRRALPVMALFVGVPVYFVAVHWWVANLWPRYIYPTMPLVEILAAGALAGWSRSAREARRRVTTRKRAAFS